MAAASGDGCALGTPQLQHRLHVLAKEGGFDCHLVGQIAIDDTCDAFEDMSEFHIGIRELTQVDHAHRDHLRLSIHHLQQPIAHQVSSWVNA